MEKESMGKRNCSRCLGETEIYPVYIDQYTIKSTNYILCASCAKIVTDEVTAYGDKIRKAQAKKDFENKNQLDLRL